jgi:hypothetical protein
MKIKAFLLLAGMAVVGVQSFAQQGTTVAREPNVITTAVPFVSIAPDARGGSMGDCGVASDADVYSMHFNPAKYTFMEQDMSVGLGYSPWLHNLVPDMGLAYLAFATKLNSSSALAATLRYFNVGEITFRDQTGTELGTYKPNEWAVDVAYSRMLTDYLSGAVAGRFIYSNLTQNAEGTNAGWSVAADVAIYYKRPVEWFRDMDADFTWGVNISNIGSKVSYRQDVVSRDFIPTTLRLGTGLKLGLDEYNTLAFMVDVTKLLVPTAPIRDPNTGEIVYGMDDNVSVMAGMIQSFYDAPGYDRNGNGSGPFMEELSEYNFGIGVEYWYNHIFSVRGGYFNESAMKGNRKYFTLGAALKYNIFGLDVSYLIPIGNTVGVSPLENTLRFNLTLDIVSKK